MRFMHFVRSAALRSSPPVCTTRISYYAHGSIRTVYQRSIGTTGTFLISSSDFFLRKNDKQPIYIIHIAHFCHWSYSHSRIDLPRPTTRHKRSVTLIVIFKPCLANTQRLRHSPTRLSFWIVLQPLLSYRNSETIQTELVQPEKQQKYIWIRRISFKSRFASFRYWIGNQHQEEYIQAILYFSHTVCRQARKSPEYCLLHFDVQGRKCVIVRKRIYQQHIIIWHNALLLS